MLSIERDRDYVDIEESDLPYEIVANLGDGGTGIVQAVRDVLTGLVYARKSMKFRGSRAEKQKQKDAFLNEIQVMRGLGYHIHLVRIFASYTTRRGVGLILDPVANGGDLRTYLEEYWDHLRTENNQTWHRARAASMIPVIERAFGCLAFGLAAIHKKEVRHKDIKPSNILLHDGIVMFTDFGCSRSFDSAEHSHSTTTGRPGMFTYKYSAPEVIRYDPRNSSSDIYSLGCVFLELFLGLTEIKEPDDIGCYSENMPELLQQIQSASIPTRYQPFLSIILRMIMPEPNDRLCAMHVATAILQAQVNIQGGSSPTPEFCCNECASTSIEVRAKCVKIQGCAASDGQIDVAAPGPGVAGFLSRERSDSKRHREYDSDRSNEGQIANAETGEDHGSMLRRQDTVFFDPRTESCYCEIPHITQYAGHNNTPSEASETLVGTQKYSMKSPGQVDSKGQLQDKQHDHNQHTVRNEFLEQSEILISSRSGRSGTALRISGFVNPDDEISVDGIGDDALRTDGHDQGMSTALLSSTWNMPDVQSALEEEEVSKSQVEADYTPLVMLGDIATQKKAALRHQEHRRIRVGSDMEDMGDLDPRCHIPQEDWPNFFTLGRIFRTILPVPDDVMIPGRTRGSTHYSVMRVGSHTFLEMQTFVVVENTGDSSRCVPIQTYRGNGAARPGLDQDEHGVIYTSEEAPPLLAHEFFTKVAVRAQATGTKNLEPSSRVNYGRQYTIEHGLKVLEIGIVIEEHRFLIEEYVYATSISGGKKALHHT